MKHISKTIIQITLWAVGILFIISGLGSLVSNPLRGILFFGVGAVTLPLIWHKIQKLNPRFFNRAARVVLFAGVLFAAGIVSPYSSANEQYANGSDSSEPEPHATVSEKLQATTPRQASTYKKQITTTEVIQFESQTVQSSTLAKGQTQVTQEGINGEKSITYSVTFNGNQDVSRTKINESITRSPVPKINTVGTYIAPARPQVPAPASSNCDPNYSGCVPIASDVDCAGGSGNGPAYFSGVARVIGSDIYRLDGDHDGWACNG